MTEKHIVLEDIDPVTFYGVNNCHLQMIRSLYPKLRIMARDNIIRVLGDEEQMCAFEESMERMQKHVARYNVISEEDILNMVKGTPTNADTSATWWCTAWPANRSKAEPPANSSL